MREDALETGISGKITTTTKIPDTDRVGELPMKSHRGETSSNGLPATLNQPYHNQTEETKEGMKERPLMPHLLLPDLDLNFIRELKRLAILPKDFPENEEDYQTDDDFERAQVTIIGETPQIVLHPNLPVPEAIIIRIPDKTALDLYQQHYGFLNSGYRNLPPESRPVIIMYTDKFKVPVNYKEYYEGFFFASTPEELQNTVKVAQDILKHKYSKTFNPKILAPAQRESYDASEDLREWEKITTDTYQSLKIIFERINKRNQRAISRYSKLFDENSDGTVSFHTGLEVNPHTLKPPEVEPLHYEPIRTVLDLGTGEGRIAGMLARLGYKVLGMDNSLEMLRRGERRFTEEGEGLRGEREHPGLSYHALLQLKEEGLLPKIGVTGRQIEPILSDEVARNNYITFLGDFFKAFPELNNYIIQWKRKRVNKNIDLYEFFNQVGNKNAFRFADNMFVFSGFDMVTINWNTFWEIGSKDIQQDVLRQLLNVMNRGGELMIEIADRNQEPYKTAIEQNHTEHPNEPYGTVRDPKPDGIGTFQPRYLSDAPELVSMLKAEGYEIKVQSADFNKDNPESDVRIYEINNQRDNAPQQNSRVYVITARKSVY